RGASRALRFWTPLALTVIASEAKQSVASQAEAWIASLLSLSLSSGAHSRDPLAPRNDGKLSCLPPPPRRPHGKRSLDQRMRRHRRRAAGRARAIRRVCQRSGVLFASRKRVKSKNPEPRSASIGTGLWRAERVFVRNHRPHVISQFAVMQAEAQV